MDFSGEADGEFVIPGSDSAESVSSALFVKEVMGETVALSCGLFSGMGVGSLGYSGTDICGQPLRGCGKDERQDSTEYGVCCCQGMGEA